MKIELKPELKGVYPEAAFGSLAVKNVPNRKTHEALEERKRDLESKIRQIYVGIDEDRIIQSYDAHFKKWGRTYPIESQIKSIRGGSRFPQVSVLVDSMFMAELKSRVLSSGHDLDAVQGDLAFEVARGGEHYLLLNGREQKTKENDVILEDEEGILGSVLHGPARRTSITPETRNAIYFAWCPYGMADKLITAHLNGILLNLRSVFEPVTSGIRIHR